MIAIKLITVINSADYCISIVLATISKPRIFFMVYWLYT
jgi:hypothetical protein